MLEIHKNFKPFLWHGLDLDQLESEQAISDCPFCGAEGKFTVERETSKFRCWKCENAGTKGNAKEFLRQFYSQLCSVSEERFADLAQDRGLLFPSTLVEWGVRVASLRGDIVVPGYSVDGKLQTLYRYIPNNKGKLYLAATPTCGTHLFGVPLFKPERKNVYVCEGPWDAMVLWELLRWTKRIEGQDGEPDTYAFTSAEGASLLTELDVNVIAVPGCNIFDEKWAFLLKDKDVTFLYDSDHPKLHCKPCKETYSKVLYSHCPTCRAELTADPEIPPSGLMGMKKAVETLGVHTSDHPSSVRILLWGEDGYDAQLPSGFDLRDFIKETNQVTHYGRAEEFLAFYDDLVKPVPVEWAGVTVGEDGEAKPGLTCLPCETWIDLMDYMRRSLVMTKGLDYCFSAMLACAASTPFIDDQLWIKIVGPAASGKSTLAEALSVCEEYIYALSTMRGFHSGVQKDDGRDCSLINEAKGKTLIIKDGDTFMQSPELPRIMAEARDVYDRKSRTHYRQGAGKIYPDIPMTWILCGTEDLGKLDQTELGPRFVTYHIIDDDFTTEIQNEIAWRAAHQANRSGTIVAKPETGNSQASPALLEAMQRTGGYVKFLRDNSQELTDKVTLADEDLEKIIKYAEFVSFMRARPPKEQRENYSKEVPTRLIKQLVRLTRMLCIVLNKESPDADVMARLLKCVRDSSRGTALRVTRYLHVCGYEGTDVVALALMTGHTQAEDRTLLSFMSKLGAVESYHPVLLDRRGNPVKDASGHVQKQAKLKWRLTPTIKALYEAAML